MCRCTDTVHVKDLNLTCLFTHSDSRLIVTSGSMWMREIAKTLEREFRPQGTVLHNTI